VAEIHDKFITPAQNRWWNMKAKELNVSVDDAYGLVEWKDINKFEKDLEKEFKMYWVQVGSSPTAVKTAANAAKRDAAKLALGTADRFKRLGIITGALGAFGLLTGKVQAFQNMKDFDPDTNASFNIFMDNYNACLAESIGSGARPSKDAMDHLIDTMFDFTADISPGDKDALDKARFVTHRVMDATYQKADDFNK